MKPFQTFSARAKNRTEAAAMNGGMEIGLTVLLFVLLGLALDSWLGTKPVFVIVLFLFAAIGSGLRYYYQYTADMEQLEAQQAARRAQRFAPPANDRTAEMNRPGRTDLAREAAR